MWQKNHPQTRQFTFSLSYLRVAYQLKGGALLHETTIPSISIVFLSTATGGQVTVSTGLTKLEEQDWIKVTVADNAPGINTADLPYIFDHFYRGDKSRDRKSGGTGLGLAIVKQLAEIHGGKVQVESTIGTGSSFYVMLPVKVHEKAIISSSVLHNDRVLYTY